MNLRLRSRPRTQCLGLLVAFIAILIGALASAPASAQTQHYVFAHYMVTNQDYASTYTDPSAVFPALGNEKIAGYEKEILQAQAEGIDGFALNCGGWLNETGNNNYYIWYSEQIFQAAVNLNTGFKLFFSCDMCCGNGVNDAEDMVRRFANDPVWSKVYFNYNGKAVLSFFDGSQLGPSGMNQIRSDLANGTNPIAPPTGYAASSTAPINVFLVPSPFWGGEVPQLPAIQSEEATWGNSIDGNLYWGIAGVPGSGGTPDNPGLDTIIASENMASVVEGAGHLYMAPICFHFWGADAARYFDYSGYEGYRKYWMDAINVTHPQWVEIITWNDFMEGSYISPIDDPMNYPLATFLVGSNVATWRSTTGPPLLYWHSHYGVADLTAFYSQWYKTGVEPAINSDEIFWAYRSQPIATNVGTPTIGTVNGPFSDTIYVTCNLAAPATLTVNSAGTVSSVNVPAGSNDIEVPLSVGAAPTFTLTRNGQTITSNTGAAAVSSTPTFNNNSTTIGLGNGLPSTTSYNDLYMVTGDSGQIPFNQAPSAPTNLTAAGAPAGSAVSLTWTASIGSNPMTYNVYRGTSAGGESTTALASGLTATSFTDTTAVNGTTYYYIVKGVNPLGTGPASNEASAKPVAPTIASVPSGLTATPSDTSINLAWNASSGTSPITYNVYRGTSSGAEGSTPVASGLTSPSYTDTGLANGTTYYYKVAAVNIAGTSGQSTEASAKTLTAVYQIDCGSGSAVSPYVADEFFSAGNEFSSGSTISTSGVVNPAPAAVYQTVRWLASFNYTIPNLTAGSSYLVRLHFCELSFTATGSREFNVAINGSSVLSNFDVFAAAGGQNIAVERDFTTTANSSGQIVIAFSQGAADNPEIAGIEIYGGAGQSQNPPPAPTGLSAAAGNSTVSLSWTGSSGATSYNVYRGTTSGGENSTPIATGLTGTSYTDSSVTNGTTYFYTAKALNAAGTSGASNEASATPELPIPPAPTNLTATGANSQVSLAWTASANATSYNVYRGTSSGAEGSTAIGTSTGTSYTDTTAVNGTTYFYTVKAVNSAGASGASNEASATAGTATPPAPTNLAATGGNATVSLTWTASANATSYNVYRGATAGGESSTAIGTSTSASYTDSSVSNGTTYYYTVKAVDSGGTSAASNEAHATPSAPQTAVYQIDCGGGAVAPFVADEFFSTGNEFSSTATINTSGVTNPAPAAVYQTVRWASAFNYTIPGLTAGQSYTVRLHFCELTWTAAGQRLFNVAINGTSYLSNFDVFATAGGQNKALVEQTTATANSSGQIVISFTQGSADNPEIAGIEIDGSGGGGGTAPPAPTNLAATGGNASVSLTWSASSGATSYSVYRGTSSGGESSTAIGTSTGTSYTDSSVTNGTKYYYTVKAVNSVGASGASNEANATPVAGLTAVYQIDCGGGAVSPFVADEFFNTGNEFSSTATINTSGVTNAAPAAVYQTVRWNSAFAYTIPNLTAGATYTVRLHFCELTWTAAGQRVFNVAINGNSYLSSFDVFKTAGAQNKALVEQTTATANSSGQIVVSFTQGSADNPEIAGIEVLH